MAVPQRHHTRSQTPIEKGSQTPVCARIRTPGTDDRSQTKIKRIVAVSQGITTAHRGNGSTFGSETPNTNAESNSRVTQNTCYEVWEEGLIGHWTCPIGSLYAKPLGTRNHSVHRDIGILTPGADETTNGNQTFYGSFPMHYKIVVKESRSARSQTPEAIVGRRLFAQTPAEDISWGSNPKYAHGSTIQLPPLTLRFSCRPCSFQDWFGISAHIVHLYLHG